MHGDPYAYGLAATARPSNYELIKVLSGSPQPPLNRRSQLNKPAVEASPSLINL
jgi:hypothetical protein